ncbi:MAG TPA: Hsp20/alpha crystallin family protein [Gemmataceae bacterium]|jgi:HSP20 family protein|nr:Hsp20/alpha crystallin family protein [Gemmataceae bacterium]
MSRDVIRLMSALFLPNVDSCRPELLCPPTDVYRTQTGWLVKFELAGARPEDIHLEALGPRLTLRGVRRDGTAAEELHCYRMEIAYSEFERSLELPCDLGQADVTTEYRDGMLLVRISTEATT